MNNHHNEHHNNDIWTCKVNKLFDDLEENVEVIESSNKGSKGVVNEDGDCPSKKRKMTKRPRARSIPWTQEEHKLFLLGLQKVGKGKWKSISEIYVQTKTPTQIASHAQKFNKRIDNPTPLDKRRRSINDTRLFEDFSSLTDIQPSFLSPQSRMPENYVPHNIERPILNNISPHPTVLQNFVPPNYNQPSIMSSQPVSQNYIPHATQHQVFNSISPQPTVSQNHVLPNFQQLAHNQMQQSIVFPNNNYW